MAHRSRTPRSPTTEAGIDRMLGFKPRRAKDAAVDLLLSLGWEAAGETPRERVLMPSKATHWCGGRSRFHLPGTDRWATVGARTVNLYVRGSNGPEGFQCFAARDLDAIRAAVGKGDKA